MSENSSSVCEKMDISDNSDSSDESQVLRLGQSPKITEQHLDNTLTTNNKNIPSVQNATNSHPLMQSNESNMSPILPDYPDLIPEKPKVKVGAYETQNFNPQAHSTVMDSSAEVFLDKRLSNLDLKVAKKYNELPDFPESPSALKRNLMYDLPVELTGEASDTENDRSVYEAHLSSNLQNVALTMNEKEGNLNFLAHKKRSNKLRRVKCEIMQEGEDSDVSSLESISESLKSENVFPVANNPSDEDNTPEPIEPLSAEDERRHARHWQRMVLPGGEQRTIDMRVIEPYKRVLSHGGYLRAGGHTAIVIFSACYLPDKSRVDYVYVMDNLFL